MWLGIAVLQNQISTLGDYTEKNTLWVKNWGHSYAKIFTGPFIDLLYRIISLPLSHLILTVALWGMKGRVIITIWEMSRLIAAITVKETSREECDRAGSGTQGLAFHTTGFLPHPGVCLWAESDVRWESCAQFPVGSTGLSALGTGHGQGWRGERALVPCKPTPLMPCGSQYRPGTSTLPWAEVYITLILTPGVCRLFLFCPFHRCECRGTERSSILSKVIQLASLKWSEFTWSHPRMFSPSQHKERNCFCFQCPYLRWAIITIYPLMAGKLFFESIYHSQAAAPVHSFDFTQTCLPLYTSKGVPLLFIDLGTGLFHERILSTFFSAGFAECLE